MEHSTEGLERAVASWERPFRTPSGAVDLMAMSQAPSIDPFYEVVDFRMYIEASRILRARKTQAKSNA